MSLLGKSTKQQREERPDISAVSRDVPRFKVWFFMRLAVPWERQKLGERLAGFLCEESFLRVQVMLQRKFEGRGTGSCNSQGLLLLSSSHMKVGERVKERRDKEEKRIKLLP